MLSFLIFIAQHAPEEFCRFAMDGRAQTPTEIKAWEEREEGSVLGVLKALAYGIETTQHHRQLKVEDLIQIHFICLKNVKFTSYAPSKNLIGEKQDFYTSENRRPYFPLLKEITFSYAGIRDIAAHIDTYPTFVLPKTEDEEKLKFYTEKSVKILEVLELPWHQFGSIRDLNLLACGSDKTGEKFYSILQTSLTELYKNLGTPHLSYDEKLLFIIRCAQLFVRIHPFLDGNIRTFGMVMLNVLLLQYDFPFAIFLNPNTLEGFSDYEMLTEVKSAMKATYDLIKKIYHAPKPYQSELFIEAKWKEFTQELVVTLGKVSQKNSNSTLALGESILNTPLEIFNVRHTIPFISQLDSSWQELIYTDDYPALMYKIIGDLSHLGVLGLLTANQVRGIRDSSLPFSLMTAIKNYLGHDKDTLSMVLINIMISYPEPSLLIPLFASAEKINWLKTHKKPENLMSSFVLLSKLFPNQPIGFLEKSVVEHPASASVNETLKELLTLIKNPCLSPSIIDQILKCRFPHYLNHLLLNWQDNENLLIMIQSVAELMNKKISIFPNLLLRNTYLLSLDKAFGILAKYNLTLNVLPFINQIIDSGEPEAFVKEELGSNKGNRFFSPPSLPSALSTSLESEGQEKIQNHP